MPFFRAFQCYIVGTCHLSTRTCRSICTTNLFDDLINRGFIHHVTDSQSLRNSLQEKRQVVYTGIDPTAQSLHIGHLIPMMSLVHFHLHGHKIMPLIGAATGRIGDPSGRRHERRPAVIDEVEDNVVRLTECISTFFKNAFRYAHARARHVQELNTQPTVMSNLQWHQSITMLDFLRHVGLHARVNTMLNRESVRSRLDSQQGLSFTEFAYQLLQAFDFYYLYENFGCTIQIGGSDQWGNILAGLELIDRLRPTPENSEELKIPAFGITTPLLTTASGQKFGKSAGNAIWLNPALTPVFDFYQYFLNVEDADLEKMFKLFTLLTLPTIQEIMAAHKVHPEKRTAQRRLANEVTEVVHGNEGVAKAQCLTKLIFESDYSELHVNQIKSAFENDSRLVLVNEQELLDVPVMKLAAKYGLVHSRSASRALIRARGLYVNNDPVLDSQHKLKRADLIDGTIAILRAGKHKLLVLVASSDSSIDWLES